jgi:hypothetical protein
LGNFFVRKKCFCSSEGYCIKEEEDEKEERKRETILIQMIDL